jgi:hypothetical protein
LRDDIPSYLSASCAADRSVTVWLRFSTEGTA